ncbi:MAG: hypothetical protein FJ109_17110 [Deltaproteobacteria bacterium]|nr:hypothetical protein [Deltaproteobacteria bacterium]
MTRIAVLLTVLAVLATACGGGETKEPLNLETQKAALTASANVKTNLVDLGLVLKILEDVTVLEKVFDLLPEGEETCARTVFPQDGSEPYEEEMPCPDDEGDDELDIDGGMKEAAEDIAKMLTDYVFNDAQVETDDGKTIVYVLKGDVFCDVGGEGEGRKPDPAGPPEKPAEPGRPADDIAREEGGEGVDCAEMLDKVSVRVKVESYSEGDLDVWILFGAEMVDPIHVQLYKGLLAVEVDLAKTKDVVQMYIDAFGEEGEEDFLPDVFEGIVRLELKKIDAGRFELKYAVKETVKVGVTQGKDLFSVEVAPGSVSVQADKGASTLSWTADVGAVTVKLPYQTWIDMTWGGDEPGEEDGPIPDGAKKPSPVPADDIADGSQPPQVSGELTIFVAGLTGEMVLDTKAETIGFTGLGLGNAASTIKLNTKTLLAIDLNKDNGREFDMTFAMDGNDLLLGTKPLFDLVLTWGMAAVAKEFDDMPAFMLDETFTVRLDSATEPTVKFFAEDENGEDPASFLQVVKGKLTLESSAAADQTVVVEEGQCLAGAEEPPVDEEALPEAKPELHDILGELAAGECE